VNVEIERLAAPLSTPFVTASGSIERRELLLLRLEDRDGFVGFGEAAPLPLHDGVHIDDCRAALEECRSVLNDSDGSEREPLLDECRRRVVLPQAVAAVDLALWDLFGKRAGQPVWALLGGGEPEPIEVNRTIAAPDRARAAAAASAAREAGFRSVKLKVGTGDDPGRVAAVRAAAGPEMAIRLDANAAWSLDEAEAALRALAPAGIELCEQPVDGIETVAELSAVSEVPLALDESSAAPGALERRACDAICLKVSRCGGISGLLETARRARSVGYEVYLASALDGSLGIAAALHTAAVLRPDRACGLATLELFDGREDPLTPQGGRIAVPDGPGLGADLIEWYRR
jgi:o-succinylbenzoate synthase